MFALELCGPSVLPSASAAACLQRRGRLRALCGEGAALPDPRHADSRALKEPDVSTQIETVRKLVVSPRNHSLGFCRHCCLLLVCCFFFCAETSALGQRAHSWLRRRQSWPEISRSCCQPVVCSFTPEVFNDFQPCQSQLQIQRASSSPSAERKTFLIAPARLNLQERLPNRKPNCWKLRRDSLSKGCSPKPLCCVHEGGSDSGCGARRTRGVCWVPSSALPLLPLLGAGTGPPRVGVSPALAVPWPQFGSAQSRVPEAQPLQTGGLSACAAVTGLLT